MGARVLRRVEHIVLVVSQLHGEFFPFVQIDLELSLR
jgi:hypothetical protein